MLILASANDALRQRWRAAPDEDFQEVTNATELAGALRATPSALVLLHLALPGLGGVDGIGALREAWPDAPCWCSATCPPSRKAAP